MRYPKGKRLLNLVFKKEYFTGYTNNLKFYNRYLLPFLLLGFGLCFLLYHQRNNINSASVFVFTTLVSLGWCGVLLFKLFEEKVARKKSEANLNVHKSRLHHIYNSGIIGLLYTRFDGVITQANDSFLDMIGYSRADLEQEKISWLAMTPPEFSEKSEAALEQLRTKGFCEPFEKEYFRKDGSRVSVMLGSSLLHSGDDAQIITYTVDITKLKNAEKQEQLMSLKMHYRQKELFRILKQAPVAVVIRKGPDLEMEYANQTALDYTGLNQQQVVGNSAENFHARLTMNFDSTVQKDVYRSGKPFSGKAQPVQYDRYGTGVLSEGWFDYVCEPMFDDKGEVDGVVTFSFEVTELVRANRDLEKNEHHFRFIADAIPHKMWTSSADGSVTYYNKGWSDYLQETNLERLNMKAWDSIHPEELEEVKRIWLETVENGTDMEIEQRLRRHDGVYQWHLTRVCSCKDDQGNVTMYVGSSTNIDDQKMAQIAMRLAMEKKDEFLGIAAHELRTPITSMKVALQSLQRTLSSSDEIGKAAPLVAIANKQVSKLTSIVNDLVDVDKIQSGKLQLNISRYALGDAVREVIAYIKIQEPGRAITIETVEEDSVNADKIRIENVVMNLLTNAIKYSTAKDTVQVVIENNNGGVKCLVKDNGIGIPNDLQPYVFDRFFRVHASSQMFSGLGLGLYISAEIIRQHGGSIGLESDEGKGSVFWFTLPT